MPKCHVEVGGEGEDLAAAVVVPVHYTGPAENREEGENELELHNRASESSSTSESEEPKYDWKGKLGYKAGQRRMTLWVAHWLISS